MIQIMYCSKVYSSKNRYGDESVLNFTKDRKINKHTHQQQAAAPVAYYSIA